MRCQTSLLLEMQKFDPCIRRSGGMDEELKAILLHFQTIKYLR